MADIKDLSPKDQETIKKILAKPESLRTTEENNILIARADYIETDEKTNISEYVTSVTLTATQIKNLFTTPIKLVGAFGAGKSIIVDEITAKISFVTPAMTGANALEFRYTNASGAKVTADIANTFINSGADAYVIVKGVVTALTPVANAPIVVRVPTANPASGNSSIKFVIKYRVITL